MYSTHSYSMHAPLRHVAHQAALTTIKKAGKARHARVDNATPRALQFAHIRSDGLERRRQKEEEARHVEDPWIQHRLRQAAQVGSSGVRPTDDGDDLDGLLGPSAEWAAATDAAVRGGAAAYAGGGGGVVRGGGGDGKAVKKGPRATSAGPTRPASGNAASHPNSKAAWDSSFSAPVSKATVGGCTSRITVDP
jgi:hypothetical protein